MAQVFVETVAANRGVSVDRVLDAFGKGDVLIGKAAVAAGMADEIGPFGTTLAKLAAGWVPSARVSAPKGPAPLLGKTLAPISAPKVSRPFRRPGPLLWSLPPSRRIEPGWPASWARLLPAPRLSETKPCARAPVSKTFDSRLPPSRSSTRSGRLTGDDHFSVKQRDDYGMWGGVLPVL